MAHMVTPRAEEAFLPPQEGCQRQVQRILQSAAFRNASMLQQLLQFLVAKVYVHGNEALKEYTIGVEVFSRSQDFDPKTDTIVRVQIHRLRQKLKEYYQTDGRHDPILINIPKGHYLPTFEVLEAAEDSEIDLDPGTKRDGLPLNGHGLESNGAPSARTVQGGKRRLFLAIFILVIAASLFACGLWVGKTWLSSRTTSQTATNSESNFDKSSDPVKAFWTAFLGNDSTPVIAYPDAVFLLDNFNDLFRFRHGATDYRGAPVDAHLAQQFASNPALVARAGKLYYENSYLGFGELKAVGMLSNLFGQMGMKPIIKPSRELTVDDLKEHNVIMLGSSSQNFAVAQLNTVGDFTFQNPDTRLEQWRGVIVNSQPRPNEAAMYRTERDPSTRVLKADYSLITIQPGIVPGRYLADLGGLDTTGSEGAVLFATSRQGIDELSKALAASEKPGNKNSFPTFQALLKIRLEKGYDVLGASLVTVHRLPANQNEVPDTSNSQPAAR